MKETYKFGLSLEAARGILGPDFMPNVRNRESVSGVFVRGLVGDSLYQKIQSADRLLQESSEKSPIHGWEIKRTYSEDEIGRGQLFLLHLWMAQGAGEEFGTWYKTGVLNQDCTYERKRAVNVRPDRELIYEDSPQVRCALSSFKVGPLRFPFKKVPKGRDISMTWAGELVVTERLASLIEKGAYKGSEIQPIWNTTVLPTAMPDFSDVPSGMELLSSAFRLGIEPSDKEFWSWLEEDAQLPMLEKALWEKMEMGRSRKSRSMNVSRYSQLVITSTPITVANQTLFGRTPFRPGSGEHCSCAYGEVRGITLLTPLTIIGSTWDGSDICVSDLYIGIRRGLYRPRRLLVVSKRLFDEMRFSGIEGFDYEIVEIV